MTRRASSRSSPARRRRRYLSAAAFLRGQKESGKASVTTVLRLENIRRGVDRRSTATVTFDYTRGRLRHRSHDRLSRLRVPNALPPRKSTAVVQPSSMGGGWSTPIRSAMTALRLLLSFALALGILMLVAPEAMAYRPRRGRHLSTWHRDKGHGYVGVQVTGHWAPPISDGQARQDRVLVRVAEHGQPRSLLPRLLDHRPPHERWRPDQRRQSGVDDRMWTAVRDRARRLRATPT